MARPATSMPQLWSGRDRHCGNEQRSANFRCNKWGGAKEHDRANQTDLHRTAVGGGCCCGSDRRCTDGCGDKWAELLGSYLPVARQCSGQQRPSPRSVPPLRRHAVSGRPPRRPSPRHGLTPNVTTAVGPPPKQDDGPRGWPRTTTTRRWRCALPPAHEGCCSGCSSAARTQSDRMCGRVQVVCPPPWPKHAWWPTSTWFGPSM